MKNNKPCKLLLSLLVSFSFLFIPVLADESEYPSSYALRNGDLTYMIMFNSGSDEWGPLISAIEARGDTPTFVLSYSASWFYFGFTSATISNGVLYPSGTWYRYDHGTVSTLDSNSNMVIDNAMFISMDRVDSNLDGANMISWTMALDFYENGVGDDQMEELINLTKDGTADSLMSSDIAESTNADLKDVIDEYDSIEQSYIEDFNTNLGNIDLSGFSWDSSFLTSATWVTTQFNELVMETPFENLITFSLIIGITLYLIGRYKG